MACHRAEEVAGYQQQDAQPSTSASDRGGSKTPVLEVRELVKHYPLGRTGAFVSAVEGVSFTLYRGETLALVGESGSGKTTTAMTTLRLTDPTSGEVAFEGNDIFALRGRALRTFRHGAQVVFQDPYSSLDPRMNVRDLISEPMVIQGDGTRQERDDRAAELLELVGLQVADGARFPHQFSGGQRQRIAIARALALHPTLLVCDEPVSALDVSVQAQILNLLRRLQRELELSYLFIAHDLSVVRYIADRVAVMYLGKIVELGSKEEIFEDPKHPYTQALLSASPVPNPDAERDPITLGGEIPSPVDPPPGCRFHTRCPLAEEVCRKQEPPLRQLSDGQLVACHLAEE
ncbi:MAG: dipeptide ABC transporter ATP-binding protein [Trueperaceae bacterium]|nr:MAG: dipeptide ABC transporter ATP-binding protein [Trueperaceae bacterium]